MGNSASSGRGHHEETVDFGYLTPQGIYTGPRDWNQSVVTQLIVQRKLAPFYRPLEDYEEDWDDDQILAARKELPEHEGGESSSRAESVTSSSARGHAKKPSTAKEPARHPEAAIYRGALECPICFLYYPPNINRSRCCDQAICTECFVQIKRADPTTTHLVSEPAACPYCVQENFGIVYTPPPWRTGLGSEGATPPSWPDSPKAASDAATNTSMKRRRKSFGHNDPDVVTVDMIHPDWEAKLAAVRAAVARRANRRIIMRQVGDRLIPVGVTSGRVHPIAPEEAGAETNESGERGSRRSRRRQQNQELNQFLGSMGLGGQDLEELMVMEAMRLSLIEHEAQQRRQKEEEEKKQREEAAANGAAAPVPSAAEEPTALSTALAALSVSEAASQSASPALSAQSAEDTVSPPRSRTSTSSQARASSPSLLSPARASTDGGRRSGRSTPTSPFGTVGAALLGAASTANAVATPSPEREPSDPIAETALPEPQSELSPAPIVGEPRVPAPPVIADETPAIAEPSATQSTVDRPSLASMENVTSSTSSVTASSYDVLPSSPESSILDEPLLADVPPTPATEGGPSTAAAS
ncbi:hypothetical protein OH76DRAFT_1404904 [Lentinus brumalis]|uniref:RING-type domain-containing protein n=1 Tax=Lentinus brumalis TaxID=2498619 RepID=A0A371D732_9APHY|nr:hypothetical protein OH76DRAFT_1404904 [Polyporus brumalis]